MPPAQSPLALLAPMTMVTVVVILPVLIRRMAVPDGHSSRRWSRCHWPLPLKKLGRISDAAGEGEVGGVGDANDC